jgi:hypothetical protein
MERSKLRKSVLSSSTGEGGSYSSETKHDRRLAPRPKLFVSTRRLQRQRLQPRMLFRVRVPVEIGFRDDILFPMIFKDTCRKIRPVIDKLSGKKDRQNVRIY